MVLLDFRVAMDHPSRNWTIICVGDTFDTSFTLHPLAVEYAKAITMTRNTLRHRLIALLSLIALIAGSHLRGGHNVKQPSLTKLNPEDNLTYTNDFSKVYQTMVQDWLGNQDSVHLFGRDFG